jgi:hypothetical protein
MYIKGIDDYQIFLKLPFTYTFKIIALFIKWENETNLYIQDGIKAGLTVQVLPLKIHLSRAARNLINQFNLATLLWLSKTIDFHWHIS